MSHNLSGSADVKDIARSCRISRGYFVSAFKVSAGITTHQWLIRSRLQRAQELLLSTDLSLADIALDCGFYDQSHFSRAFAKRFGVPRSEEHTSELPHLMRISYDVFCWT